MSRPLRVGDLISLGICGAVDFDAVEDDGHLLQKGVRVRISANLDWIEHTEQRAVRRRNDRAVERRDIVGNFVAGLRSHHGESGGLMPTRRDKVDGGGWRAAVLAYES